MPLKYGTYRDFMQFVMYMYQMHSSLCCRDWLVRIAVAFSSSPPEWPFPGHLCVRADILWLMEKKAFNLADHQILPIQKLQMWSWTWSKSSPILLVSITLMCTAMYFKFAFIYGFLCPIKLYETASILEHGIWDNLNLCLSHGYSRWVQNKLPLSPLKMGAVVFV